MVTDLMRRGTRSRAGSAGRARVGPDGGAARSDGGRCAEVTRRQLSVKATAATAPIPPPAAMTEAGVTTSAAAPAVTKAAPWATTMPMLAMPNAWARRSSGTLTTKAVLTASW